MRKKTTNQQIEELAAMVKSGFDATASREDMDAGFKGVTASFKEVNERLDRIESTVTGHGNRIDRIVDDVRLLKTKVGMR